MLAESKLFGSIARGIARGIVRLYYCKPEISGREKIPSTGPILFVANHANSLIDPAVIGITADRPVHFLAKAPLFQIPVFGRILRALGMLPAYRGSDDPSQVGGNVKSLGEAAAYLEQGETVGIFPEGKSHDALKVDKVRSGAARIALQAFQQGATDLKIVPLGINYERKEKFRSSIWVRVGDPISLGEWRERIQEDERAAMRALTAEVDRGLKQVVIHLNEERWEPFIGDLEALIPAAGENKRSPIAALRQRKRIADAVNYFLEIDRSRAESIAGEIKTHRDQLNAAGLDMQSDLFRLRYAKLFLRQTWDFFLLFIGFVPALLGTICNFIPFALVRLLGLILPKQNRSTVSLERLGLGLPIYGAWHVYLWFRLADYFLPWVATAATGLMLLSGAFALNYWPRARDLFKLWLSESKLLFRKSELQGLRERHIELRERLSGLTEEFRRVHPLEKPARVIPLWWWIGRRAVFRLACIAISLAAIYWTAGWVQQTNVSLLKPGGLNFAQISAATANQYVAEDGKSLAEILLGLEELERNALRVQAELASGQRNFYTQHDNDAIRQLLFTYFSYRNELLRLIWKYQNYASAADDKLRWETFLIELTAASALYESSFKIVTQFAQSPEAIRKLNEAEPLWEIPEGAYDMMRANLANAKMRRLWTDALTAYDTKKTEAAQWELSPSPFEIFHQTIARAAIVKDGVEQLGKNWTLDSSIGNAQKVGKSAIYRGQSFLSTWVGDTRVRQPRNGQALIQPAELKELRSQLQPGDILIERQNWYLSRAFMPGYWAHTAIYVGTTNDLVKLGLDKDPRVQKFWNQFSQKDAAGNEFVILEAVPRGVRMTTLEHCIGVADSAAVLRPKISLEKLPEMIAQAFVHVGKPYDFEFDFFSTDKLVCTELVYRSCGNAIHLPLVEVLGRKTLPPTEIVRKFVNERGSTNAELQFVAFLDGEESAGKARFRDEAAFAETIHRPSLTWLQK
ncbi:MAG: 1-acyl-sn-glycerol-3-phosphate acyltransferase [Verrucomicrobia bacterium]|nr:1-acyl-sn-glycerol-3-phosphate acyltransferase [Verrucomicrobiota bacterium]